MLAQFPNFKRLEAEDKAIFDDFTKRFPPYSDFNFVSLFSYDYGTNAYCFLNDNLVITLPDYNSGVPIYSFLGTNKTQDTIESLFHFLDNNNLPLMLKLLPEESVKQDLNLLIPRYQLFEDRDSFDYVLSPSKIFALEGPEFRMQRNAIRKFEKEVPEYEVKDINLDDDETEEQILNLTHYWGVRKNKSEDEINHEVSATSHLLNLTETIDLVALGVYVEEKLIAFFIAELLPNEWAIGHFRKADTNFPNIFKFIDHQMAKKLAERGYKYFNFEQDMGIETLRNAKQDWQPVGFLKKYIIAQK